MTEIVVRQRNQVTIPAEVAAAADVHPGSRFDLTFHNGVITLRPIHHLPPGEALMQFAGVGQGLWGTTRDEIDAAISAERESWDR